MEKLILLAVVVAPIALFLQLFILWRLAHVESEHRPQRLSEMATEKCPHCGELVSYPRGGFLPVTCAHCGGSIAAGAGAKEGQPPTLRTLKMMVDTSPLITVGVDGYADPPSEFSDLPQHAAWYAKQAWGMRGAGDTPEEAVRDLVRRTREWLVTVEEAL